MKTSKQLRFIKPLAALAVACACASLPVNTRANDWINSGTGWWNDPANWNGGVPDNSGGWAIGNVNNGGTAIVSNTVPNVSEAWAGNGGVAGNIIVTNGGTLTVDNWLVVSRMYLAPSPTPLSTLTVENGVIYKNGNWGDGQLIVGDAYNGMAGPGLATFAGTGLVQINGGAFRIGAGNSQGTVVIKDNAELRFMVNANAWFGVGQEDGSATVAMSGNALLNMGNRDLNIGDAGNGRGTFNLTGNAQVNVSRFWIGKFDSSIGALWQSGGTILGTGADANEWCIGGDNSGAANSGGFYQLDSGTLANPFNLHIGRWGKGLFYQTGGTVTLGGWTAVGREANGMGVVYITGGQFSHTNTGPAMMIAEQPSRGEMTLAGTGAVTTAGRLVIGNGGNAIFNLNGGTLRVPQIVRWNGTSYLNFNGGTLQVDANQPNFMSGLTEAVVYSGNAIIDTAGYDAGISQPLVAPAGDGVVSIPISDGGSGYLTPPIVQIDTSGLGAGATAVAQINPATGVLTNIAITSSGYGYGAAPNVNLIGGGATIPAALNPATMAAVASGGLVKNGNGILTLAGANTYSGPTVVNGGKLAVRTDSVGGGTLTVADAAGLGVTVATAGSQLNHSSFTLGAATLDFDLGSFGNPALAPINVAGVFAANGAVVVNVATALPQLGQFPLITYGSRTGSGSFTVGSLPTGVVANIVTNGNSIALNVTAVAAPRWEGQVAGGVWDIGSTANWIEMSTTLPTTYAEGNAVLFNDEATGTTSVALGVSVHPAKVTFYNTNLSYTLAGSGRISGATGLTKQGAGDVALHTQNDYTGVTRIEGGTVTVTNLANGGQPSPIGSSSSAANNLVLAGGALRYNGAAATVDRGYSLQAANTGIDVQTDLALSGPLNAAPGSGFVKTGPGRLAYVGAGVRELSGGAAPAGYAVANGTVVFDGTGGAQTNHTQNDFHVGNTVNQGASLILSNTTLNVDSWFSIGRGNGTVGNVSTATLYDSRVRTANLSIGWDAGIPGNLASQILTLRGNSSISNNADMNIGESFGSTSSIYLHDNSVFFSDSRVHLGWHNGGVGSMTLSNSAVVNVDAWFSLGHEGGTGTLTLWDNSLVNVLWDMNVTDVNTGSATMDIHDNAVVRANNFFVGKGAGSTGIVNQDGGSAVGRLNDGNEIHIGFHGPGTWNLSSGSMIMPNHWFIIGRWSDGPGTFNMNGGTVIHGTNNTGRLFRVGEDGVGVLHLNAGSIETACNEVTIGWNASGDGTLNLNGGSFQARRIIGGTGLSTFNFNGGVLRAGPNANANFMSALGNAVVMAGGAVIDTGTNNVGVNVALTDGGGNGGLTKQGSGALYLNAANTYVGATLVSAGTLGGNGSIAGPVTVAAGASLSPGTSLGTLTINNTLTLAGTSTTVLEVDKNANLSDLVAGVSTVTYGGTLVLKNLGGVLAVGDTFNVFDAATFNGSFSSVVSQTPGQTVTWDVSQLTVDGTVRVATAVANPVVLISSVNGGNLDLTWGQLGYRLEVQSNPLSVGLSNNWVTVPGSETVTGISVPISTSTPTVFYRLVFP